MNTRATFLAVAALVASVAMANPPSSVTELKGKKIPAFSMKGVSGKKYTNATLKGKVVILDFWATWCGPCKMASPTMEMLHKKYAKKGLVVLGSNISDTVGAVKDYAKKHGYTYEFTQGNDDLASDWGISGIPAFLFIDRKGVVRRVDTGFSLVQSPGEFESTVKKLLAG